AFLATVDALPLAAGGDKHDSPPDRDRAGLGLGRAQAQLAELAAHEGPDVHLGIRMRLVLGVLAPRHERGGPGTPLLERRAPGTRCERGSDPFSTSSPSSEPCEVRNSTSTSSAGCMRDASALSVWASPETLASG